MRLKRPILGKGLLTVNQPTRIPAIAHNPSLSSTCLQIVRSKGTWTTGKRIVFSGIQPTGVPHIGNYLGALQTWVKLQNESDDNTQLFYCIVDLHALTLRPNPEQLAKWKRETLATLLAIGLDPERSCIFYQSDVPAHSELMWILSCCSSMGELSRMTQWKMKYQQSKSPDSLDGALKSQLQLGLFSYPVLQAADILLYQSTEVPVGKDQMQHIEFARNCAGILNHHYGTQFPKPEAILTSATRIASLRHPTQKMSKSDLASSSKILLTDSPDVVRDAVRQAVTDSLPGISFDVANRPGVSNLITIMSSLQSQPTTPKEIADRFKDSSKGAFKEAVTELILEKLSPLQKSYNKLIDDGSSRHLDMVAANGATTARAKAAETLDLVRTAVGI